VDAVSSPPSYAVVVPTVGRASLQHLLDGLATAAGPAPAAVVVVDDRHDPGGELPIAVPPELAGLVTLARGGGRGPAAARNAGWRAVGPDVAWVVFLDDDVVPAPDWRERLCADLAGLPPAVAGSQGRVVVPLPTDRRPTDWERNTAGLADARWATADMAYRRTVLEQVGGFDERFPRAYREDADLALRVLAAGHVLVVGARSVTHPVRPADRWVSLRTQAGNADDVLMRRLHGPDWRERAGVPPGRRRRHLATTASGVTALALAAAGRGRPARLAALGWLAGTAELTLARILPGPRTPAEVARMLVTSAVLPAYAMAHWTRGLLRHRRARPHIPALPTAGSQHGHAGEPDPPADGPERRPRRVAAVLFDRDGTLVRDVPYNGDPARVEPMPGARAALDRLRAEGLRLGVVSNQSGVARGLVSHADVSRVNARVDELLGPFDVWEFCPHDPAAGCGCRKPAPGMVNAAAARLRVAPSEVVVIGDIGSDMEAAAAAGARAVLVPTDVTRPQEVRDAPAVARDLAEAVDLVLGGAP